MNKLTSGVVAGLLAVAAIGATYAGKAQLAAFLGDPGTADLLAAAVASVGALVAGVLKGVKAA